MTSFVPIEKRGRVHEPDSCWFCLEMAKREARMRLIITGIIVFAVFGILYGLYYAIGGR